MEEESDLDRLNTEWVTVNAIRGMVKLATNSDMAKSTYSNILDLGGVLYPELLGPETSILRREFESDLCKEYRQKSQLLSLRRNIEVPAIDIVNTDIEELRGLLSLATNSSRVDQLKKRLIQLNNVKDELIIKPHTETQLIFRDAYNVDRGIKSLASSQAAKDFRLTDDKALRLRVLHPERPEHITGADIIYERHDIKNERISIVAVQYKIWENRKLPFTDERMLSQIDKMKKFLCDKDACCAGGGDQRYRFPFCSAFIRPTDKLQKADQKLISYGEHLPICSIQDCLTLGPKGGVLLEYDSFKDVSLSSEMFEVLFNRGKIGSRSFSYNEIELMYEQVKVTDYGDRVIIYAQEINN
ncbi:hypothetical protein [Pantoea rwandensis]|uniref:Uncharacterized protein n=1 Tax=Pantoea rwandensis TaxID=1076550 RepID=A0ABM5RH78_9GAMM|nr:hypothetical protein [Pantoea rwandensis]AIR85334.1 hypothetical protein LH22_07605 [Pantoea rwandensis]